MEARILEAERRLEKAVRRRPPIRPWPRITRRWASACDALEAAQAAVDDLYARWAELEAKVKA